MLNWVGVHLKRQEKTSWSYRWFGELRQVIDKSSNIKNSFGQITFRKVSVGNISIAPFFVRRKLSSF